MSFDTVRDDLLATLRAEARGAPDSGISSIVDYGVGQPGLIPLWMGEGDLPTPGFICDAAARSLAAGETFYTWQRGIPELRQALSDYHAAIYGGAFSVERFCVTGSGMQAIQIAFRMVTGTGDEVLVPSPNWPNSAGAAGIAGARIVDVPMDFSPRGWTLDPRRLEAAVTPHTKALFINSPGNPTGWVLGHDGLREVLDFARRHGLWIVADEVYGRFHYEGYRAPSFHDVADPDDRILYVNTFSKNWAMTGWRAGWIEAPDALGQTVENMIQYSTSGVPVFVQRAAVAALTEGEEFVAWQVARARRGRDIACDILGATGRVRFAPPAGAFYLFLTIDDHPDVARLVYTLVDEAGVGLAPGDAFGPAGAGFLRLCFARGEESLAEGVQRLADWIGR